mmetsp:Transcript_34368/g.60237  ORF Transcript_34368/g.60237 Transcript_34368/m.60237 type:complete len:127 (-) Transcript_34368:15-395(-)
MYTPTDELILHSQRAFDVCRKEVYDYEDCLNLDYYSKTRPELCAAESLSLIKCYNKVERVEPICLQAFNNFRECYFMYGGQLLTCEREAEEFNRCQENPRWYADSVFPLKKGTRPVYDPTGNKAKF